MHNELSLVIKCSKADNCEETLKKIENFTNCAS